MKKILLPTIVMLLSYNFSNAQVVQAIDSLSNEVLTSIHKDKIENSDSTKSSTFKIYPYAFYTPESKLSVGAGGIYTFYTGDGDKLKPSKIGFGGYYTTNKQYSISINNVYYFANNNIYFHLPISYGRFVKKYWGVGKDAPDYENASYTMQTLAATLTFQLPPAWFLADRSGLIVDYDYTEIVDKQGNVLLENDTLAGANGGQLIGIGADLVWDTRDNIFFPNSGGYQYFKSVFYPGVSDNVFAFFELDVRHYRAFSKDHVFAANFFLQAATGDTPFYKLPAIGGKQMRGYFFGRYRDNFMAMIQVEYRQYFYKKLGFVVFGTVGNVSPSILDYNFKSIKYTYGTGLRYLFNAKEKINLRADLGFGPNGNMGIYFGIEEAF